VIAAHATAPTQAVAAHSHTPRAILPIAVHHGCLSINFPTLNFHPFSRSELSI